MWSAQSAAAGCPAYQDRWPSPRWRRRGVRIAKAPKEAVKTKLEPWCREILEGPKAPHRTRPPNSSRRWLSGWRTADGKQPARPPLTQISVRGDRHQRPSAPHVGRITVQADIENQPLSQWVRFSRGSDTGRKHAPWAWSRSLHAKSMPSRCGFPFWLFSLSGHNATLQNCGLWSVEGGRLLCQQIR